MHFNLNKLDLCCRHTLTLASFYQHSDVITIFLIELGANSNKILNKLILYWICIKTSKVREWLKWESGVRSLTGDTPKKEGIKTTKKVIELKSHDCSRSCVKKTRFLNLSHTSGNFYFHTGWTIFIWNGIVLSHRWWVIADWMCIHS